MIARRRDTAPMSDHVYKSVEITGSSPEGVTQAIDRAVAKAAESLRGLDWFELTGVRGHIEDGRVAHYQATLKIGFRLED
jgi:flavin-binding protein dodecin